LEGQQSSAAGNLLQAGTKTAGRFISKDKANALTLNFCPLRFFFRKKPPDSEESNGVFGKKCF